jgi:hypothetical protein
MQQAGKDGFTQVVQQADPASLRCDRGAMELGPSKPVPGQYAGFTRPLYTIILGDKRLPPGPQHSARVGMLVIVFDSPAMALQCARVGMYALQHQLVHPDDPSSGFRPFTPISYSTVGLDLHQPGASGTIAGSTGDYQTYLSDGRVLALGDAYNVHDSRIVEDDLSRYASELAG